MRDSGGGGGPLQPYDSHFDEFGDIKADIHAMKAYADRLAASIETNYSPQVDKVTQPMTTALPPVPALFEELHSFLTVHHEAQNNTLKNVFVYDAGSLDFATAAHKMSQDYAGSDAFAHAKVSDINKDLGVVPKVAPTTDGTTNTKLGTEG